MCKSSGKREEKFTRGEKRGRRGDPKTIRRREFEKGKGKRKPTTL